MDGVYGKGAGLSMYLPKAGVENQICRKKPKAGHTPQDMTGLFAIVVPLIPDHTSRFRYRKQVTLIR